MRGERAKRWVKGGRRAAAPAVTGFWLWALVECLLNEPDTGNEKVAWTIVIVFTTILRAILYLVARRPRRMAKLCR